MTSSYIAIAAAFALGALLAWWVERNRRKLEVARMEKENLNLRDQWAESRDQLQLAEEESAKKSEQIARLEERAAAARESFEEVRAGLPDAFKSLASQVLEERSKVFAQQNQENLGHLLEPLKNQLEGFQRRIEAAHSEQVRDSASLREQIAIMVHSTHQIGEQANSLAVALRGSSKAQGNWGEVVLERILESAGLRSGHEYVAQESFAMENGGRAQPDIVLYLPGNRNLVIDSKVSLVHYEDFCNAATDEGRSAALAGHLASVRHHIKGLTEKKYETLYGLNSLDFVIMFLPIEPAFMLALSRDDKLWDQAWQRNVLLVGPGTLMFVVRTVSYLWRQEQQKKNVEEIAKRGATLYDRLVDFVSDLTAIGQQLEKAQKSYDGALSRLSTGRGSVIGQAEKLKSLGVKASKQLPKGLVDRMEDLDSDPSPDQDSGL